MYKFLLCWRYLKTRYLAMACIISVMLGVATLIVVNSVMSGFSTKLRDRLHGLLSDIQIEYPGMEGFPNPKAKMETIRNHPFLGPRVEAMAESIEIPAMLQYKWPNGEPVTRWVRIIGVNPVERAKIGGFAEHLIFADQRTTPSFEMSESARQQFEKNEQFFMKWQQQNDQQFNPDEPPPPAPPQVEVKIPKGIILGNLIATI